MKKRFTLMMMVLCFLMSIPLKMMAETVTIHFVDKESTKWESYAAYVYDTTKPNDGSNRVTGEWPGQKVTNSEDIKTLANGYKVVTWTIDLKTFALSNVVVVFNNQNNGKQYPASGQPGMEVKNGYYYYSDGTMSDTAPSGTETGGGTEGGGSTGPTEKWDTEKTNRLTEKPRVYSQGFYLAGNFFTFDEKDKINYDDAVFKFQQQTDQDIPIAEGAKTVYDIYKVEIPASLTAHGQVMYVDEFGKIKNIFGPGQEYFISNTCPETDKFKGWFDTKANVCDPITQENTNYWNFVSRNETKDNYSDGMYNLYIAVDSKTHTVKKWKIVHDSDKRVAYFISDAPDATAMPLYDAYDKDVKYFSNRFYASANISAGRNYYVISNYVHDFTLIKYTKDNYGTIENSKNYLATANKLFLQGNGGYEFSSSDQHNEFSPNEKPMLGSDLGTRIVEYKAKQANYESANTANHLGIRGQVFIRDGFKITSVSMVGDAIPGTLKVDETTGKEVWDFTSKAADMTYDDVEQCYKTTLVTTVDEGKKHFRFVGNHDPKINWYEDSKDVASMKAKTPLTDPAAEGHTADANDPNKVNYTQGNDNPEEDWNIIWNRPAGRWTVRLYFYTYNVAGEPVTEYYYTISANRELELRDFEDVVYKSLDNKRNIRLRGDYKYFRTWSAIKAWKISKDVDIFVVDAIDKDGKDGVKFHLKKISADANDNVIPSNTGVILATKKTAEDIEGGAVFRERASLTTYNTLVIPMEEYGSTTATTDYAGTNLLWPLVEAQVVPTYNKDKREYNYLFGFYRANKVPNNTIFKDDNDFLLGFWISNGTGAFYNNSAYLPIDEATAKKMNLGVSFNDIDIATGAKKLPALLFDFANVGGTTGINEVVNQNSKLNDGKYYTLSGQQVEKPTAGGIYIHNGKKYIVK